MKLTENQVRQAMRLAIGLRLDGEYYDIIAYMEDAVHLLQDYGGECIVSYAEIANSDVVFYKVVEISESELNNAVIM